MATRSGIPARIKLRAAVRRQSCRCLLAFRRFVLGFYTREFRDLFFAEDPPQRMFRSIITVFAGYWRPAFATRVWVSLFFLLIRLQRHFHLVPPVECSSTESLTVPPPSTVPDV